MNTPTESPFIEQIKTVPGAAELVDWAEAQLRGGRTPDDIRDQMRRCLAIVEAERADAEGGPAILVAANIMVPLEHAVGLIITWIESNYSPWTYSIAPKNPDMAADLNNKNEGPYYAAESYWLNEGRVEVLFDGPHDEEGSGASSRVIGLPEIVSALRLLAEKYPRHFADLMDENYDAETGDIFGQLLCLGTVIYG